MSLQKWIIMTINIRAVFLHLWKGVRGFLILTSIFLIGQWIAGYLIFPVPGAVIGMVLIFGLLQLGWLPLIWVDTAAAWLLGFLGLFYVPYGVGIVDSGPLIKEWGWEIIAVMALTTVVVFFASGWLFQVLIKSNSSVDE